MLVERLLWCDGQSQGVSSQYRVPSPSGVRVVATSVAHRLEANASVGPSLAVPGCPLLWIYGFMEPTKLGTFALGSDGCRPSRAIGDEPIIILQKARAVKHIFPLSRPRAPVWPWQSAIAAPRIASTRVMVSFYDVAIGIMSPWLPVRADQRIGQPATPRPRPARCAGRSA